MASTANQQLVAVQRVESAQVAQKLRPQARELVRVEQSARTRVISCHTSPGGPGPGPCSQGGPGQTHSQGGPGQGAQARSRSGGPCTKWTRLCPGLVFSRECTHSVRVQNGECAEAVERSGRQVAQLVVVQVPVGSMAFCTVSNIHLGASVVTCHIKSCHTES